MKRKPTAISKVLPSIAMVEEIPRLGAVGERLLGTAFAIDERGYVVTANHVIRDLEPKNIEIRFARSGGPDQPYAMSPNVVQAVYPHPVVDVAVLALKKSIPNRVLLKNRRQALPTDWGVVVNPKRSIVVTVRSGTSSDCQGNSSAVAWPLLQLRSISC